MDMVALEAMVLTVPKYTLKAFDFKKWIKTTDALTEAIADLRSAVRITRHQSLPCRLTRVVRIIVTESVILIRSPLSRNCHNWSIMRQWYLDGGRG
jgi:hypothetical protein